MPSYLLILRGLFLGEFLVQQCEEPSFPWVVTYAISICTLANIQGRQQYFVWPLSGHRRRNLVDAFADYTFLFVFSECLGSFRCHRNSGESDLLRCPLLYPDARRLIPSSFSCQVKQSRDKSTNHFRREVFYLPWGSLFCREVFYFAVRFFILPWGSLFCREVFYLPWGSLFCREVFYFAVRFFILPWGSLFCREILYFAVRFFILPWDSLFCREILYFAVRLLLLPWHFWATVGRGSSVHQMIPMKIAQ